MNTTSVRRVFVPCITFLGAISLLMGGSGCARDVDISKVKCVDDSSCPKNYTCSPIPGQSYGTCIAGVRPSDGGQPDQALPSTFDGSLGTGGGAIDGPRGSGGVAAGGGAGGVVTGGGTGGSIGTVTGLGGNGGATSTLGATGGIVSSGGTTTIRDADTDTPLLLPNGSVCTADSQCMNGHCVDGVCCDSKCDGQCQACNEKSNPGQCVAVSGDPRGTRTACGGTAPCKGQCDGKTASACTFPGATTPCTAASCKDGLATPASVCNGAGACTVVAAAACPTNLCASDGSGKCAGSCTSTSCGADSYCNGAGVCTKKAGPGTICGGKDECLSGFCVDGVCCSSACTEQCQACNAAGTCARITGAPRSGRTACTATDPTCAGSCDGTSDKCVYKGAETVCSAAGCADASTLNTTRVCNGAGACTAASQTNCATSGQYCSTNQCVAKIADGGSCTSSTQCSSGNCSNGTCCGSGKTGCAGTCVDLKASSLNCGQCGRACTNGQSCCTGSCVDVSNSNTDCGSCGHACGSQVCTAGICCDASNTACGGSCCDTNHTCSSSSCTCQGYALPCGGCGAWNFESNTIEGWIKTPPALVAAASCNAVQTITVSASRADQGTHSLAVKVANIQPCSTGSSTVVADFAVQLCPSGASVTLPAGLNVYADFYFLSDSGFTIDSFAPFGAGFFGPGDFQSFMDPAMGTTVPSTPWFTFHGTLSSAVTATHLTFNWIPNGWAGTIYVDKIRLGM